MSHVILSFLTKDAIQTDEQQLLSNKKKKKLLKVEI